MPSLASLLTACATSLVIAVGCGAPAAPAPTTPASTTPAAAASPPATPPAVPALVPLSVGGCSNGRTFTLGPPMPYAIHGLTGAVELGDLNSDHIVDLVVGDSDDAHRALLGVMLGKGDGTFAAPASYPLLPGGESRSVALTDFDTDEDLDVVTAGGSGSPQVLLNNGDGSFGQPVVLPVRTGKAISGPAVVVRVADIHGDAHPDVVTYAGGGFDVWHDAGHATFVASDLAPVDGLEHGAGLTIADLDRDGATDIAVAGIDHGAPTVIVLLGKKRGVFGRPARYPLGTTGMPVAVVSADFNGDGKLDLAALVVDGNRGTLVAMYGKGDGTFAAPHATAVVNPGDHAALVAADLDGDGKADLVASTADGLAVFRTTGTAFADAVVVPASGIRGIAAGDLRGDHALGLVATTPEAVIVWPGACQ